MEQRKMQPKKWRRLGLGFCLVTLLFFLFAASSASAQQPGQIADLIIADIDVEQFPDVQIHARIVDAQRVPVGGVTGAALEVLEDGEPVGAERLTVSGEEGGIWVHFVLDAGTQISRAGAQGGGPRWQEMVNAVTSFVQTEPWMQSNLDQVAITVSEPGGPRLISDFSTDGAALAAALANYQPPYGNDGYSYLAPVLTETLDELAKIPEAADHAQFIVLLTFDIDAYTGLTGVGEVAAEQEVPIHVLTERAGGATSVQNLTAPSGGTIGSYTIRSQREGLYGSLIAYRQQYLLSYRSTVNTSGAHEVEVRASNTGAASPFSEKETYEVTVNPPRVIIDDPGDGQIILRSTDQYTEQTETIQPTSYTVVANVSFPDEHPRRLLTAELFNGEQSLWSISNPSARIEIPWDLRGVGSAGFSLTVEIRDELGLISRSQPVLMSVELSIPEAPTESAEMIIQTVVATVAPPTATPCTAPGPLCTASEVVSKNSGVISLGSMGIAAAALVFSAFVYINRAKIAPAVASASAGVGKAITRLTRRSAPSVAKAYIIVMDGDTNVGRSLAMHGTTRLGRSRQDADLLFQQHDEESMVSRLHCTVLDNEDHFSIRDEDSANGTYHNGIRLRPLEEEILEDGDEIELGQVERGGVRLLFQLADEGGAAPDPTRVTNRVRKVDHRDGRRPEGEDF
jgi:hypothetical protein